MPAIVRLSTQDVEQTDQFDYWSETLSQAYESKTLIQDKDARLRGQVETVDCATHVVSLAEQTPSICVHNAVDARRDAPAVSLFLLTKGQVNVIAGNTATRFGPGQILVSDSEQPYRHELLRGVQMNIVQFPKDRYLQAIGEYRHVNGQVFHQSLSGQSTLVSLFQNYWRDLSAGMGIQQAQVMDQVLLAMVRSMLDADELDMPGSETFVKIRHFIEAHLDKPELGPDTIASACNMSVRKLHGLFANQGQTVARFVKLRRLTRAAELLRSTYDQTRPISDIALASGFENFSQFSTNFKQEYGMTPREYRKSSAPN